MTDIDIASVRRRGHRRRSILMAIMLLPACKTTDESEERARTAAEAKADGNAISAVCREGDDLSPELQDELTTAAREVHAALVAGEVDDVLQSFHPRTRAGQDEQALLDALRGMSARLAQVDAKSSTYDRVTLVEVSGGVSDLTRTICEGTASQGHVTMLLNAGDEDVALVTMKSPGDPIGYTTALTLRKHGEKWSTVAVHVGPHSYRGRSSEDLESMGATLVRGGKRVPAFILFALARTLSDRGAGVRTQARDRLDEKLAKLEKDPGLKSELGTWSLGGQSFELDSLSLVATKSQISPVVHYRSPGGLVPEHLEREGDLLLSELGRRYPELAEMFDAVVFEASVEKPGGDAKTYDAYRLVRFFTRDPSGGS